MKCLCGLEYHVWQVAVWDFFNVVTQTATSPYLAEQASLGITALYSLEAVNVLPGESVITVCVCTLSQASSRYLSGRRE